MLKCFLCNTKDDSVLYTADLLGTAYCNSCFAIVKSTAGEYKLLYTNHTDPAIYLEGNCCICSIWVRTSEHGALLNTHPTPKIGCASHFEHYCSLPHGGNRRHQGMEYCIYLAQLKKILRPSPLELPPL